MSEENQPPNESTDKTSPTTSHHDTPTSSITLATSEQFSVIGQSLTAVPPSIKGAEMVKQLDLSYNSLTKLENLDQFKNLNSLVVDNNELDTVQNFPFMPTLQTLWVNNNNITELKPFVDSVVKAFPNLTYLSMLKNPACPNYFTGKDFDDYKRYRLYVLYRLKTLKFLDYTGVTEEEKKEAVRRGPYLLTVKADLSQMKQNIKTETEEDGDPLPMLPNDLQQEGKGTARFGLSNYVYVGKHSEGNRFITNDNL